MVKVRRWLQGRQEGLSLLELTVVAAILAILAALTAVAVTGTTTETKGVARTNDTAEVNKAISSYTGANPFSQYPTSSGCKAGEVPNSVTSICATTGAVAGTDYFEVDEAFYALDIDGDGLLTGTSLKVVNIDFARALADGTGRTFSPDLIAKPKHADELTASTADHASVKVWVVNTSGEAVALTSAY